ncbi:hypothetical protein HYC85_028329 [Camellia sinensis]|uniref:Uncharacterized protein n=1 Tax=Camellia sinensis TaxID=4442 RepID=A0A7J7FWY9_CAMSI|nr:hypothetical protein HYC85_028329 [Camellia sinensis]
MQCFASQIMCPQMPLQIKRMYFTRYTLSPLSIISLITLLILGHVRDFFGLQLLVVLLSYVPSPIDKLCCNTCDQPCHTPFFLRSANLIFMSIPFQHYHLLSNLDIAIPSPSPIPQLKITGLKMTTHNSTMMLAKTKVS